MFNKNNNKIQADITYSVIIFISLISVLGAIIYRIYALNIVGIAATAIIAIGATISLARAGGLKLANKTETGDYSSIDKVNKLSWGLPIIHILLLAGATIFLFKARTAHYLISPWELVSPWFFILYALATIALGLEINNNRPPKIKTILISIHYLVGLLVTVIVYKLGYGFDPSIHQASVEYINNHGFIPPKTLYYIGQYAIEIFGHKFFGLPISWLNYLLVPVLVSIFVPITLKKFLAESRDIAPHKSLLTILFLPIITFSPFIITTPQGLAYLFLILTIFWTIIISKKTNLSLSGWIGPAIIALATFCIHPLAGIPAILFYGLSFLKHPENSVKYSIIRKLRGALIFLTLLLGAMGLPAAFFINNRSALVWQWPWLDKFSNFGLPNQESFILNFLSAYDRNWILIISIIIGLSIYTVIKNKKKELAPSSLMIGALLISYIVTKQLDFSFLINYEQSDYPNRILTLIIIFSLPGIIYLFQILINKIYKQSTASKIIWLIFGSTLLSAAVYISYPRRDNYFNSRGFSTSNFDVEAVNLIESQATKPYIVLANQAVSAAALRQFGFERYLENGLYFYPIPTSSPLYQYYLDMVYKKPTKDKIIAAMQMSKTEEAYLVINKYWWESNKTMAEAIIEADDYFWIGGKEILILKYKTKEVLR